MTLVTNGRVYDMLDDNEFSMTSWSIRIRYSLTGRAAPTR